MTQSRHDKKTDCKWVRYITLFVIILGLTTSLIFFGVGKINNTLKSQVKAQLDKLSNHSSYKIKYKDIGFNSNLEPEITEIKIIQKKDNTFLSLFSIDRMTFHYTIRWRPDFKIIISKVSLLHPKLELNLDKNLEAKNTNKQLENKSQRLKTIIVSKKIKLTRLIKNISDQKIKIAKEPFIVVKNGGLSTSESTEALRITSINAVAQINLNDLTVLAKANFNWGQASKRSTIQVQGSPNAIKITADLKNIKPNVFLQYRPDFIVGDDKTNINLKFTTTLPLDKPIRKIAVVFSGDIYNLNIYHEILASKPITDINFSLGGNILWDKTKKEISFTPVRFWQKNANLTTTGMIQYGKNYRIKSKLTLDKIDIQDLLEVIPKDFIPVIYNAQTTGSIAFKIDFELDSKKPHRLVFNPDVQIENYKLLKAPLKADIFKLKKTFWHIVRKKGKVVKKIQLDPKRNSFISYRNLGETIKKGVLTCEDGRFFRHNGFQLKHIRKSIIENIKKGRFARGGSTISMQLSKNLFLSGEKNLSRKFQELLLTYAIEKYLDKKRILEIYMNIIEWGPGIYGVGSASQHYFYKHPSKLTPLEAAFMGSIISNPVRHHYMYSRGEVTDSWATYLKVILPKMHIDYDQDTDYHPVFGWVKKKREKFALEQVSLDKKSKRKRKRK